MVAVAVAFTALGAVASAANGGPTRFAGDAKVAGITRAGASYHFKTVTERSADGRLRVSLPTAWSNHAAAALRRPNTDEVYGVGIRASTDLAKLSKTYDVAGVRVTVTSEVPDPFDPVGVLQANMFTGCRAHRIFDYDNGTYSGKARIFSRCGQQATAGIVVAALDRAHDVFVVVAGQARTKADLAAIDRALATAKLTPAVPST